VLYYGAEVHAILGDRAEALSNLRQAVDRGFVTIQYLDHHQQPFYPLHGLAKDPEFRAIRGELARRVESFKRV
jgi:hypothetical protein